MLHASLMGSGVWGRMDTRVPSLSTCNYHNSVNWLHPNTKRFLVLKKKKIGKKKNGGFGSDPTHISRGWSREEKLDVVRAQDRPWSERNACGRSPASLLGNTQPRGAAACPEGRGLGSRAAGRLPGLSPLSPRKESPRSARRSHTCGRRQGD